MSATSSLTSMRSRLQRLAPREGQQAPRQIGAAQRRVERIADQFRRSRRRRSIRVAQQIEIADDDAEQIVEIVRHAAGEIADRLHLLRLAQLRLGLLLLD